MASMKISTNNISNNSSERLLPSAITSYSVCNQTLVALPSSDSTIHDYDNQVLFVLVDMYEDDSNKPNCTQCAICKDNFFIPKITKCGHIFCYACIMGYMVACGSTQLVKCPLCSRWIHAPELKSLIWRNVKRLKVGDKIKFHLYRYNVETNTVERMRENFDKTTNRRKNFNNQLPPKHTFEYLWNHVEHWGNAQLYVNQTEHNLILPDNNIYFVANDRLNLTLFDVEKSVLIDRINDTTISAEEMMAYLACNDHFNDFIDRLTKQFQAYAEQHQHPSTAISNIYNKNSIDTSINEIRSSARITTTVNKKSDDPCNDTIVAAISIKDGNTLEKHSASIPIIPLVKPEFIKTPRDLKNRSSLVNENDYRFIKYLFFYKNEIYFNTYMSNINCHQIANYLLNNKRIFDDQLHLPIKVEGVLFQVENYEPESAQLADFTWKYCSSMVKFLGFCSVQLTHPFQLEMPPIGVLQYKYSIKNPRANYAASSTTSSVTGDADLQNSLENFNLNLTRNSTAPVQYLSTSINNTTHNAYSEVYPDFQSYYYDYFGNKNDDFPSFD